MKSLELLDSCDLVRGHSSHPRLAERFCLSGIQVGDGHRSIAPFSVIVMHIDMDTHRLQQLTAIISNHSADYCGELSAFPWTELLALGHIKLAVRQGNAVGLDASQ